ncbi:MAG: sigma-54 dependent transcriptional regulator [bacterium]
MTRHALVVDDEPGIRFALRGLLEERGFHVDEAASGERALEALAQLDYDVAFVDIVMSGMSGMDVLDRVRAAGSETPMIVMTAQDTMRNAVEAMKRGAFDYVTKPFDLAEIEVIAERALEMRGMRRTVERLKGRERDAPSPEITLVGRSPVMQQLFKTIGRIAASDATVMLEGESGTGKELIAHAIHKNGSRASGPFVPVNSAAIPAELLESELFGHSRGAFTGATDARAGRFEEADGGTLFLDEIGEMSLPLQSKILRVLEDRRIQRVGGGPIREVNVRVVAATHRDLEAEVEAGRFRRDLFYRLAVVRVRVPPLRERLDDLPLLVEHFLARHAVDVGGATRAVDREVIEAMRRHSWPGNVRELENAVRRALLLGAAPVLRLVDFPELGRGAPTASAPPDGAKLEQLARAAIAAELDAGVSRWGTLHRDVLDQIERPLVELILERTGGNQLKAADWLGINRNTLRKKIRLLKVVLDRAGGAGG